MKRLRLIVLGLAVLTTLSVLHYKFGLFNRFNFVTAYWDRWTGNERIIIYGELFENDSLKTVLAPRFGFKYERAAGCLVTHPFVNGVDDYNKVMGQKIRERLGDDWDNVLEKEISKIK